MTSLSHAQDAPANNTDSTNNFENGTLCDRQYFFFIGYLTKKLKWVKYDKSG